MFHVIEITDTAVGLSIDSGRLAVKAPSETQFFTLKETDALIIANPAVSLSGFVLNALAENHAPVVICNKAFCPTGILLPVGNTSAQSDATFELQTNSSLPLKKKLWQNLIKSKIRNQSDVLVRYRQNSRLAFTAESVRSGDPDNIEAQAANAYWKNLDLFPKRDRNALDANLLFNYAYAILYSATARYLCAASLHPHLGIKHHNQYNPFCLASDLMEPYRAVADSIILELLEGNGFDTSLSSENRRHLLQKLYSAQVLLNKQKNGLFNALKNTVAGFKKCLAENSTRFLPLPILLFWT